MRLGLDLSDVHARAVVVDDDGRVLARGAHAFTGALDGRCRRRSPARGPGRRRCSGEGCGRGPRAAPGWPGARGRTADSRPAARPARARRGVGRRGRRRRRAVVRRPRAVSSNVVALSAGEHVTSGIILDGRVWPGAHGRAGSVGWLSLNPVEREDYRRLGGLEAESLGGWHRAPHHLAHQVGRRIHHRAAAPGRSLAHHGRTGVCSGRAPATGCACRSFATRRSTLGMALSNLAAILDPEAIVLGGMIAVLRRPAARVDPDGVPAAGSARHRRSACASSSRRSASTRRPSGRLASRACPHDRSRRRRCRPARPRPLWRIAPHRRRRGSSAIEPGPVAACGRRGARAWRPPDRARLHRRARPRRGGRRRPRRSRRGVGRGRAPAAIRRDGFLPDVGGLRSADARSVPRCGGAGPRGAGAARRRWCCPRISRATSSTRRGAARSRRTACRTYGRDRGRRHRRRGLHGRRHHACAPHASRRASASSPWRRSWTADSSWFGCCASAATSSRSATRARPTTRPRRPLPPASRTRPTCSTG